MIAITEAIKRVVDCASLTASEAESVLEQIMDGRCTDAQIAALLVALRMKGETAEELAGFARAMRRRAARVPTAARGDVIVDTCGTGGDSSCTFNISTAAAFVVAGAGVRVAKHGNRSVSSRSGSADVLEALGIKIELPPERVAACIDQIGIGFLYAPIFHGAMKHALPARRQIAIRTIFNLLGPLTNPAGANAQLMGVYSAELTELIARTLSQLGTRRAMVVCGQDGLDEITITASTKVTELSDGKLMTYYLNPEDFGLRRASIEEIRGGDPQQNAKIILEVLRGAHGPRRDIVLLNAAAALKVSGRAETLQEALELSSRSIDHGLALEKLQKLIELTNS
jgi:anthranilate phosphoribosyltransferase